ncbi:MAG: hypothetical protein EXR72_21805 [Myxococcales bacterium]|nr:hypothetical protein [Myxococcales bacterium]
MPRNVVLFFALAVGAVACKKEETVEKTVEQVVEAKALAPAAAAPIAPAQPVAAPAAVAAAGPLDVSSAGDDWKGFTLAAPAGATAKGGLLGLEVKQGDGFHLEMSTGKSDLAARKKEIQGNDINKLKRFLTDSKDALVYETEVMGTSEFHFAAHVKAGGKDFHCEDSKGPS